MTAYAITQVGCNVGLVNQVLKGEGNNFISMVKDVKGSGMAILSFFAM